MALQSSRLPLVTSTLLVVLALAGCAPSASESKVSTPGASGVSAEEASAPASETTSGLIDPSGNVVLFVDNGSIPGDAIDIVIEIDGEVVVDRVFPSARDSNEQPSPDQGNYVLSLPPGPHTIRALSTSGQASLEKPFEVNGRLWVAVAYSYNTKRYGTPGRRQFNIVISEKEIGRL